MNHSTRTHASHSAHAHTGILKSKFYHSYFRPAVYLALAILFPIAAKIFQASMLVAVLGSMSIFVLVISKIWKIQLGLLLSMIFLLLMVMLNIWHWTDSFFIALFAGNILTEKLSFQHGLVEGLIVLTGLWCYHKLLKSMRMRVTHEWFVKKSQLKFLKGLLFFQLFLIFFWVAGYALHLYQSGNRYDTHAVTLVAGVIALVAAGIPTLVYLLNSRDTHSKQHHHRHHRHHDEDDADE